MVVGAGVVVVGFGVVVGLGVVVGSGVVVGGNVAEIGWEMLINSGVNMTEYSHVVLLIKGSGGGVKCTVIPSIQIYLQFQIFRYRYLKISNHHCLYNSHICF